jgi:acyl dehydratase
MTTTVATPAELLELVGDELGPTEWQEIPATRVELFRTATGTGTGTAGGDTAPGDVVPPLLLLSLVNLFLPELLTVETFSAGLNVGLDGVGYPAPAPPGTPIRARGEVLAAEEVKGGVQVTVRVTLESGADHEAVCVADTVSRFLP